MRLQVAARGILRDGHRAVLASCGARIASCCWAVPKVGATLLATLIATQGVWITGECPTPRAHRPPCRALSLEFSLAACVPVNSRTAPRRRGRITHKPEDVPYRGFDPELPCYPQLSLGSSRCEVDDRRPQGCRAPHRWECLTIQGAALWDLRPLCGPPRATDFDALGRGGDEAMTQMQMVLRLRPRKIQVEVEQQASASST